MESCEDLEKEENRTHAAEHHITDDEDPSNGGPSLFNVTSWGEDTDKTKGNSTEITEETTEPEVKAKVSTKLRSSKNKK